MSPEKKKRGLSAFLSPEQEKKKNRGMGAFVDPEKESFEQKPEPVNKYAIKVMSQININISKNESNHINDFDNILFDYVITVCDNALEICPVFNNARKHIHKSFRDPAKFKGNLKDTLNFYSKIRDEISLFIIKLIKEDILKEETC